MLPAQTDRRDKLVADVIRRSIRVTAALLAAVPLLSAHAAPQVLDAGYRLARHGKLYWIDSDRVLFYGGTAKQRLGKRNDRAKGPGSGGTYIWNVRSGALEHISEWEITCYHPDYSTWSLMHAESGQRRFKAGKFGQETELSSEERKLQSAPGQMRDDFTCKTHSRSDLSPPAPRGRRIIVLRDGDGYLDFGHEISFEPTPQFESIVFYRHASSEPMQLPLLVKERLSSPVYSEFVDAYILFPSQDRSRPNTSDPVWPKERPQPIYQLNRDGQLKTTIVPAGEWHDVHHPTPTKAGLIFSGGDFYRNLGLWLLEAGKVRRLIAGYVHALKVSPNGCEAAIGIQLKHLEMGTPIHLKVVDLCVGGR